MTVDGRAPAGRQDDAPMMFKVRFDLDEEKASWAPAYSELLWVEKVGAGLGRVRNAPLYALGVAVDDVIAVVPDHANRQFVFDRVVSRSGRSTVDLVAMSDEQRGAISRVVADLGLWGEWDHPVLALDVPADADDTAILSRLVALYEPGVPEIREAWVAEGYRSGREG